MGYIEYCIMYPNGEVWNETRAFYDMGDLMRISEKGYLDMLMQSYKAERVMIVCVRLNEHNYLGMPTIDRYQEKKAPPSSPPPRILHL